MAEQLTSLENKIQKAVAAPYFKTIGKVAQENGEQAFAIGGYVRDTILGRPCTDVDIVVSDKGPEIAKACATALDVK